MIASVADRLGARWGIRNEKVFRQTMREFISREIAPFVNEWDEAEEFPRDLYRKAAAIGLLGLNYPEEFGGTPADGFYSIIASVELAAAGSGGVARRVPGPCRLLHPLSVRPPCRAAGGRFPVRLAE